MNFGFTDVLLYIDEKRRNDHDHVIYDRANTVENKFGYL